MQVIGNSNLNSYKYLNTILETLRIISTQVDKHCSPINPNRNSDDGIWNANKDQGIEKTRSG